MGRFITPPAAGEDVRKLYLKVAECIDAVNAISNMKVTVEGREHMQGQLKVGGGSSVLRIESGSEVGSRGT